MKFLPEVIVSGAMAALAFELVPMYGQMVAGLFDRVSLGLSLSLAQHLL